MLFARSDYGFQQHRQANMSRLLHPQSLLCMAYQAGGDGWGMHYEHRTWLLPT